MNKWPIIYWFVVGAGVIVIVLAAWVLRAAPDDSDDGAAGW